jgi:hypothetical protein
MPRIGHSLLGGVLFCATVSFAQSFQPLQPSTAGLYAGQTVQFSYPATVGATWAISPVGLGSVSASGLYRAPSNISAITIVTVSATIATTPVREYRATVTLRPLRVTVAPASVTLTVDASRQFISSVTTGAPDGIVWSLDPPNVGSVSPAGL